MLRFNFTEEKVGFLEKYLRLDILLPILLALILVFVEIQIESPLQQNLNNANNQISQLKAEKKSLEHIKKELKGLKTRKAALQEELGIANKLESQRKVPDYLYFLGNRHNVGYGIWFDSLSQEDSTLNLRGNCLNLKHMSKFIDRVNNSIGNVVFKRTAINNFRTSKGLNVPYYKFLLGVNLKNGNLK